MNIFSRKYHLNPETLRFEQVRMSSRQKVRLSLALAMGIIMIAIGLRIGFEHVYTTPKEIIYSKENASLRAEYQQLNDNLHFVENHLALLKNRDDKLYRSILGLEPVSSTIRAAGTGGSERYTEVRNIADPEMVINVFRKVDNITNKVRIQSSSLEDLYQKAIENKKLLACKPSIQPISPGDHYWLTSTYGHRIDPFTKVRTGHYGIDLAGPFGLEIHATGDGEVAIAEFNRHGYGKEVVIEHGFGYSTRYAHLQEIFVKSGEKVSRGQVIGLLGSTGRSTGPHLHYEVRYFNGTVNPMYYFYENLSPEEFSKLASNAINPDMDKGSYALSKK